MNSEPSRTGPVWLWLVALWMMAEVVEVPINAGAVQRRDAACATSDVELGGPHAHSHEVLPEMFDAEPEELGPLTQEVVGAHIPSGVRIHSRSVSAA